MSFLLQWGVNSCCTSSFLCLLPTPTSPSRRVWISWCYVLIYNNSFRMLSCFYSTFLCLFLNSALFSRPLNLPSKSLITNSNGCFFFPPHYQAIFWHQMGILQFNSILTLSAYRKHQIPQGKGWVPQDCSPSPLQRPILDCHLCINGLTIKQRFQDPLLGFYLFARVAHRTQRNPFTH